MAGNEWNGKWVTFVFDGTAINFKGGGGKVTVTGLSADVVKKGVTVTVKQGTKVIDSVVGTATGSLVKYNNVTVNQRNGSVRTLSIAGVCPFYKSLTKDDILAAPANIYSASGSITVTTSGYDPASGVITLTVTGGYNSVPIGYCTVAVVNKG